MPALADLLVDLVWWLESCGDEEVDPDSAVKMMESVGWALVQLPSDQRQRLSQVLADLAEAEQDPARREFLESFPFAIGMVEDNESLPSDLGVLRDPARQATSGTRTD
ncbi:hypothetical protein [Streptomyces sp. NPDC001980]|uniref:hypothetical protein n=1 Tax=Streptomyces sp. NPDC001980 TaxID=3157126 RepID=UPI003316F52C